MSGYLTETAEQVRTMARDKESADDTEREIQAAAREGKLGEYLATHHEEGHATLYRMVSDLVFERYSRPWERVRGHHLCAVSVDRLEPECHDRHQDAVEAVRADLLRHADRPIANLGGWLVPRLNPVIIDAHRKRRGEQGAHQKPRLPLPRWLDTAIEHDPWLAQLAVEIMRWVGVPVAVHNGLWPLGAWADRRAAATGESGCTEGRVARDVERVLAAMRTDPVWYDKYIERPLGRKQAPLAAYQDDGSEPREPSFVSIVAPHEAADARLADLAGEAIAAIAQRAARGEDLRKVVVEVVEAAFGAGTGADDMDRTPGSAPDVDERVARLLVDPATVERVVNTILDIVEHG